MTETRGYLDAIKSNMPYQEYLKWENSIGIQYCDYRLGIHNCAEEMKGYRDALLHHKDSLLEYSNWANAVLANPYYAKGISQRVHEIQGYMDATRNNYSPGQCEAYAKQLLESNPAYAKGLRQAGWEIKGYSDAIENFIKNPTSPDEFYKQWATNMETIPFYAKGIRNGASEIKGYKDALAVLKTGNLSEDFYEKWATSQEADPFYANGIRAAFSTKLMEETKESKLLSEKINYEKLLGNKFPVYRSEAETIKSLSVDGSKIENESPYFSTALPDSVVLNDPAAWTMINYHKTIEAYRNGNAETRENILAPFNDLIRDPRNIQWINRVTEKIPGIAQYELTMQAYQEGSPEQKKAISASLENLATDPKNVEWVTEAKNNIHYVTTVLAYQQGSPEQKAAINASLQNLATDKKNTQWVAASQRAIHQYNLNLPHEEASRKEAEKKQKKKRKKKQQKSIAIGTVISLAAPGVGTAFCAAMNITNTIAVAAIKGIITGALNSAAQHNNIIEGGLKGGFTSVLGAPITETLDAARKGENPGKVVLKSVITSAMQAVLPDLPIQPGMLKSVESSLIADVLVNKTPIKDAFTNAAISSLQNEAQALGEKAASGISESIRQTREEKKSSSSTHVIKQGLNENNTRKVEPSTPSSPHTPKNNNILDKQQSENSLILPEVEKWDKEDKRQPSNQQPPQGNFNLPNIDTRNPHKQPEKPGKDSKHFNHAAEEMIVHEIATHLKLPKLGLAVAAVEAAFKVHNATYNETNSEVKVCKSVGIVTEALTTFEASKVVIGTGIALAPTNPVGAITFVPLGLMGASIIGENAGKGAELACHEAYTVARKVPELMNALRK